MANIEIYTLFSGSKGNCVFLKAGQSRVLIDAGRSLGAIDKALRLIGSSIGQIDAVVVTHEHSDHVNALALLMAKHGIPIHMTEKTARAYEAKNHVTFSSIVTHPTEYEIEVGDFRISSFPTPHDSADSVGYIVSAGGETVGYATDMGCPTKQVLEKLTGCSRVIIESNYDEHMLRTGPYPEFLKSRILSKRGHMSNDGCARLVCELASRGVRSFILAHLSENNNLPEVALRTSCDALCAAGHTDVNIIVASAHCPTKF